MTPSKWTIKGKSTINQDCDFDPDTYQQLKPKFRKDIIIIAISHIHRLHYVDDLNTTHLQVKEKCKKQRK